MDLNPQFFDECTANYKQQRLQERQRQRNRDEAWQHLRESVLQNAADKNIKLPDNLMTPIPPLEVADISLLDDEDYSIDGLTGQDGDEQMSVEGPSMVVDEQMEEGIDQHGEMVSVCVQSKSLLCAGKAMSSVWAYRAGRFV